MSANDSLRIEKCSVLSTTWKYERLLWIAYLKNENNKKCLLASMPKDIIKQIVTMF